MAKTFSFVTAALCAALLLGACGSSKSSAHTATQTSAPAADVSAAGSSTTVKSGHTDVAIRNFMFSPMHLTVKVGTKVSFHNYDGTSHTATADNQSFDTGTIKPGKTVTLTFKKAGTYAYKCLFHAFMTATIKVVPG